MGLLKISGGTIYDPINGLDGVVGDVWIRDGRVIEPPRDPGIVPDRVLDARGLVVMPGGIDIHAHIAGPKVNAARKMRPEDHRQAPPVVRGRWHRSGAGGSVPSTFATGYLYAGLGYTTAFDAAVPPLGARHAHEEFHDTPVIDKGFFVLMGNNHYVLQQIARGEYNRLRDFAAWLLGAAKGYAIKLVNPGGVEAWKAVRAGNVTRLDDPVPAFGVTPRQIVQQLARVTMDLQLPHPVHIHCNNLGLPGNWRTTLETMQALAGLRAHLTHIQFHSYGGSLVDLAGGPQAPEAREPFCSRVAELADFVNTHPEITVDVGQVLFGETTSMTGDGPLGYYLHRITGRKWFNADTELEEGCAIVPITYRPSSSIHALQWAIGLEWFLLVKNPWQICMSTDHPNGGAFLAYPQIVHLLMDRDYRRACLAKVHAKVKERCLLADLEREYSLFEIAIITRAAPARILGLKDKGHLGPGASGDVTVYSPSADRTAMFSFPRYVIKAGEIMLDNGEPVTELFGRTLYVQPQFDEAALKDIRRWFEEYYTIQFANYPVDERYLDAGGRRPPA